MNNVRLDTILVRQQRNRLTDILVAAVAAFGIISGGVAFAANARVAPARAEAPAARVAEVDQSPAAFTLHQLELRERTVVR